MATRALALKENGESLLGANPAVAVYLDEQPVTQPTVVASQAAKCAEPMAPVAKSAVVTDSGAPSDDVEMAALDISSFYDLATPSPAGTETALPENSPPHQADSSSRASADVAMRV